MATVRLTWTNPNDGIIAVDGFNVYRSTTPFDGVDYGAALATLGPGRSSYTDSTAISDTDYYYVVGSTRNGQESYSAQKAIRPTGETVTIVFEPTPVDPIDPTTLDGVGGLSVKVFDPSNLSFLYTTNAESTNVAADGDRVGSFKDVLGSGTAFTTGTASLRPTYRTDGTYHWLEFDGSNALSVAGSAGLFKYLHDGTGGEFIAGVRFGTTDNPDALYTFLDNTNLSLSGIGMFCYYDNRSTTDRKNHIEYAVSRGVGAAGLPPVRMDMNNLVNANQDCVIGGSFEAKAGDEATFITDGKTVHSSQLFTASSSNATYSLTLGRRVSSADFYLTGRVYYLCIIDGVLTEAQRAGVDAYIATKTPRIANETKLHSFDAGSRKEWFVDQSNIDASTGVKFDVQRFEKHTSNPLVVPDDWDEDVYFPTVLQNSGGTFEAWVGAAGVDDFPRAGYMTSTDGLAFTKPNLGIEDYDGDTNNNLLNLGYDTTIHFDGTEYVAMEGAPYGAGSVGDEKGRIKTSANGITGWTLEKTLDPAAFHPGLFQFEFHGMALRSDGRWVAYYTFDHDADRRSIAAYVSDTTDVSGAWTHIGALTGLDADDEYTQFYNFSASLINGVLYGIACRFNDITERIWIDLYTSEGDDGVTWTPRKGNILPHGRIGTGDYDGGMAVAKNLLDTGTETRIYYTGSVNNHISAFPRDSRLCVARLASGRMGVVYGVGGTVTTTAFTATEDLKVNAKSTGGNLKVELLDPSDDSVLTGFAKADCDNLDGNELAKVVTWNGSPIPTGYAVKAKFYLDS